MLKSFFLHVTLLAQEAQKAAPQDGAPGQPGAPAAPGGSMFAMLIPFVAILVLFYFMIIRPQRRQEQKRQETIGALKKDDQVVTIGGIVGTVANTTDRFVVLKLEDGQKIKMLKTAISSRLDEAAAETAAKSS